MKKLLLLLILSISFFCNGQAPNTAFINSNGATALIYQGDFVFDSSDILAADNNASIYISVGSTKEWPQSVQIDPDTVLVGEYTNYFIEKGNVYTHDAGTLVQFPLPEKIKRGSAGHPWALLIGESGQCYMALGDSKTWKKVSITGAESSSSYFNFHVVVLKDGTVTAINDKLEQTSLRSAGVIVQAAAAHYLLLRNVNGEVYQYKWSSAPKVIRPVSDLKTLSYSKVSLPGPATDITTSRSMFSAAVVNNQAYVWCDAFGAPYVGLTRASAPVLLSSASNIERVYASDNTLHILTTNRWLYGMGNNWVGEVGTGEIDSRVAAGNADMGNRTFVSRPVLIDTGVAWVSKGTYYGFRNFLKTLRGVLKAWGYPKFGLLSFGIRPVDDPANIGIAAITRPWGIQVANKLVLYTTAQLKAMKAAGTYPPKEYVKPRNLIYTICTRYYDDGTTESERN